MAVGFDFAGSELTRLLLCNNLKATPSVSFAHPPMSLPSLAVTQVARFALPFQHLWSDRDECFFVDLKGHDCFQQKQCSTAATYY